MISFTYRWRIPQELHEEFEQNWEELTQQVLSIYEISSAVLYRCGEDHVSITTWLSEESWDKWIQEQANHSYRMKWRQYKVSSERLNPIVQLGACPKEPSSSP